MVDLPSVRHSGSELRPKSSALPEATPVLFRLLVVRCDAEQRRWFLGAMGLGDELDRAAFDAGMADATLRVGSDPLALDEDEEARLDDVGVTWGIGGWGLDGLARVLLVLRAAPRVDFDRHAALIREGYRDGDLGERQALLQALPLVPLPDRFLHLALHAASSDEPQLFEAIASDNPYPARCFPSVELCELVERALWRGIPIARMAELGSRHDRELRLLAEHLVRACRAMQRPLPPGVLRLLDPRRRDG